MKAGVDIVLIESINQAQVRGGLWSYGINANTLSLPKTFVHYSTLNQHHATLCDWGRQCEWPLEIAWKQTPYGRDIVRVEKAATR